MHNNNNNIRIRMSHTSMFKSDENNKEAKRVRNDTYTQCGFITGDAAPAVRRRVWDIL